MGKISLAYVSIDSADFRSLADFYVKLLDGKIAREFGEHGVSVGLPGTDINLNFLDAEGYEPPVGGTWETTADGTSGFFCR